MFLQQELWLILVGLLTAWVIKKNSGTAVPYTKIALYACLSSLIVGEFGMFAKGFAPLLSFFPTDIRGFIITTLAAFLAAKFVIRSPRTRNNNTNTTATTRRKKK